MDFVVALVEPRVAMGRAADNVPKSVECSPVDDKLQRPGTDALTPSAFGRCGAGIICYGPKEGICALTRCRLLATWTETGSRRFVVSASSPEQKQIACGFDPQVGFFHLAQKMVKDACSLSLTSLRLLVDICHRSPLRV